LFSIKKRELIEAARVNSSKLQNWSVFLLFIFILVSFILLANLNRDKIFNKIDSSYSNNPNIESL
jgi:preprotein translocase subunit SecG